MQRIANLLMDPAWWASTVVVALIVNLAAAYAKPLVDAVAARLNLTFRLAAQRRRAEFTSEVANLERSLETRLISWFLVVLLAIAELGALISFVGLAVAFAIAQRSGNHAGMWCALVLQLGVAIMAVALISRALFHGRTLFAAMDGPAQELLHPSVSAQSSRDATGGAETSGPTMR
jgi:hypothetical protein